TLRDALQITPVDTNNVFSSPPTPDALIKFVNDLGYPKVVRTLSDVVTKDMFQPWRALTTVINLCLTGKTSGKDIGRIHPIHPYFHGRQKESSIAYSGKKESHPYCDPECEQYYNAYLEKVAKHQRYLAGEEVSDPDSPAPKPAKATKPKSSKQSKPLAPKVATKKPKPAPAKTQGKKRKLVTETSKAPSPIKRSKAENEPKIGDEEVDLQKAVEESLKEFHSAHQEVQGKGKEKVSDEQAALDLLTLQTPKQRSLCRSVHLLEAETDSDEDVPGIDAGVQDEGRAGPNPGEQDEGHAGPNPDDAVASQPPSSHVVLVGPDLEHMNLEASNTSLQPNPEQMDEGIQLQGLSNVRRVSQPVPTVVQTPLPTIIATATATTTTTTLPLIPPQPQQGSSDSILIKHIGELEQHMADMVEANQALEERLDKQGTRLYNLENLDIPHQVSKAVDEIVTDAVNWALQAPLRDRFRDLPKADMKEILHHRMWESNSYQAHCWFQSMDLVVLDRSKTTRLETLWNIYKDYAELIFIYSEETIKQ
ncbi:retrovirus-related pol polyprotein from transposon TNT 1-94, partial [Tanacetum coccineum]